MKLKANYKKLTLRIDGFTPYTLPMGRLAEYLKDLAAIFGTQTDAHFIEVGDGSADVPWYGAVHVFPPWIIRTESPRPFLNKHHIFAKALNARADIHF